MKTETFKSSAATAYGETLPKAIEYSGSFDAFENPSEVRSANEWLSDDEVVSAVNAKRKANARQKAMTIALEAAGYSKPDPNSPEQIRKNMITLYTKSGFPQEVAEKMVDGALAQAAKLKGETVNA